MKKPFFITLALLIATRAFSTVNVTVENLNHTYDKTGKSAIATTVPAGLTVDLTYNGSTTLPINVGTYTVVGTINDPNHAGSATNTLIITPAALTVVGLAADKVYDGSLTATLTGTAAASGVIAGDLVTVTSLVYDNSVNDLFARFDLEGLEIGDEITLASPANRVSSFSFEYWAVGGAGGAFSGPVEAILRFYKNDGTVIPGLTPEARLPGTLLFKSKPFPINPTDRAVLVYTEAGDFTNAAAADILLTEPLPSSFTWSVEFIGLGAGDSVGLDVYSPPVNGSSHDDYWRRIGPGIDDWALRTYEANPPINFGARLEIPITGTFGDKHAGNGKVVTINGLTLSGADAGNYTLTPTITANITPRPATVAAVTDTKTYDGTTSSVGVPTITPMLASGDSTTVRSQAFQTRHAGVGNKVLIPAITINDGNGGANYTVTPQNFNTGTINPLGVTVVANNWFKTYGDTVAFAGMEYNASGLIDGDGVTSVTLTSDGAPATANVSNYAIVPSAAQGTGLANYAISYVSGVLMVSKATLTASADNKSRAYGQSNPIFTISYEGFANGDDRNDVDSPPAANTTATTTSGAGDYDITLTGGADNNYTFNLVNGTLTVTSAATPEITAISLANGLTVITWNAIAGREYKLQFKDHVTDTDWVELATAVLATGPTASAENLVGNLPQRFYRVKLLPSP